MGVGRSPCFQASSIGDEGALPPAWAGYGKLQSGTQQRKTSPSGGNPLKGEGVRRLQWNARWAMLKGKTMEEPRVRRELT
jgi:hypothetical protein